MSSLVVDFSFYIRISYVVGVYYYTCGYPKLIKL